MKDYPINHPNHILERKSERFFRNQLPAEWIVNKPENDYGIDFNCEIVHNHQVSGLSFSIQLKAKKIENDTNYVIIKNIKRSTINYWLKKLEPIMISIYIEHENKAYWQWVDDKTFDLSKNNSFFQIKIDRKNSLSNIEWSQISDYTENIFKRRHYLYNVPLPSEIEKNKGWDYYFNREYEKALPLLLEEQENLDSSVLNAIAICYFQIYSYKHALIFINKALEIEENIICLQNKAAILTEYGNQQENKDFGYEANNIYKKIKALSPNDFVEKNSYNYANNLKFIKNYKEAILMYRKHLKINPNNAEAWKNLGSSYFELKLHQEELFCYEKALTINPNLVQALFSKGNTLFFIFGNDDGLEYMLEAFHKDTAKYFELEFPYVYYWIAEAYNRLGKTKEALYWNEKGYINNFTDKYFREQSERLKSKL